MHTLRKPWLVVLSLMLTCLQGCRSVPRHCDCPMPSACPMAGIYPTVLTPYNCDGIDVASLEKQLRHELAGEVQGLLVLGTLGEGEHLSDEERAVVMRTAVRVAGGGVPVVVGIHTCDLEKALAQMRQAKELGASAVLVKFSGQPRTSGSTVLAFFTALSDQQILPILYYHYPSQTRLRLRPQTIAAILALPGVIGIKESTLNLPEVQAHLRLVQGQGKLFFSGTALNLTQFMAAGGQGAMCPEAVLLPGTTVQAYHAFLEGRHAEARAYQKDLFALTPILRTRPTVPALTRVELMTAMDLRLAIPMNNDHPQARMKDALNEMGLPTPTHVRHPLPPLTPLDHARVVRTVSRLQVPQHPGILAKSPALPH